MQFLQAHRIVYFSHMFHDVDEEMVVMAKRQLFGTDEDPDMMDYNEHYDDHEGDQHSQELPVHHSKEPLPSVPVPSDAAATGGLGLSGHHNMPAVESHNATDTGLSEFIRCT